MPALRPHALEAVMDFQVCKTHLDFLALVARFFECRRAFKSTHMIASVFVYVAWDHALRRIWAALGLKGTGAARARPVAQNLACEDAPRRLQDLAGRTDVDVALSIKPEVVASECPIVAVTVIPHTSAGRFSPLGPLRITADS
jgi:hypothetical protein